MEPFDFEEFVAGRAAVTAGGWTLMCVRETVSSGRDRCQARASKAGHISINVLVNNIGEVIVSLGACTAYLEHDALYFIRSAPESMRPSPQAAPTPPTWTHADQVKYNQMGERRENWLQYRNAALRNMFVSTQRPILFGSCEHTDAMVDWLANNVDAIRDALAPFDSGIRVKADDNGN